MSLTTYFQELKDKKAALGGFLNSATNHPTRLVKVVPDGAITLRLDAKEATNAVIAPYEIDITMEMKSMDLWDRIYGNNFHALLSQPALGTSEFRMMVQPIAPWFINSITVGDDNPVFVGTAIVRTYTGGPPDPWVLDDTYTTDISAFFIPYIGLVYGGGASISGGQENPATGFIQWQHPLQFDYDTTSFSTATEDALNYVMGIIKDAADSVIFERLPWEEPWDAIDTEISTAFDTAIDAAQTADGGIWDASCSLAYHFGYDPPAEGALDFSQSNQSMNLIFI